MCDSLPPILTVSTFVNIGWGVIDFQTTYTAAKTNLLEKHKADRRFPCCPTDGTDKRTTAPRQTVRDFSAPH